MCRRSRACCAKRITGSDSVSLARPATRANFGPIVTSATPSQLAGGEVCAMTHAQRRYLQPHRTNEQEWFALPATQLGVITRQQLLASGLGERAIDYRLSAGALIRCFPGIYRLPPVPSTWQQELLAACFWAGGVASHRAAGVLWRAAGIARQMGASHHCWASDRCRSEPRGSSGPSGRRRRLRPSEDGPVVGLHRPFR